MSILCILDFYVFASATLDDSTEIEHRVASRRVASHHPSRPGQVGTVAVVRFFSCNFAETVAGVNEP